MSSPARLGLSYPGSGCIDFKTKIPLFRFGDYLKTLKATRIRRSVSIPHLRQKLVLRYDKDISRIASCLVAVDADGIESEDGYIREVYLLKDGATYKRVHRLEEEEHMKWSAIESRVGETDVAQAVKTCQFICLSRKITGADNDSKNEWDGAFLDLL